MSAFGIHFSIETLVAILVGVIAAIWVGYYFYNKSKSQALKLDPNYADAYYGRGLIRQEKGDLNGAIEDFENSIRIKPDFSQAKVQLEQARFAKKKETGWV